MTTDQPARQPQQVLTPIIGIIVALIISALIALAGSQGSADLGGVPLFLWCAGVGFALHWLVFIPSYIFKTEHYFDLTGSLSFLATMLLAVLGHPDIHLRGLVIAALVVIWSGRLGSFLFMRVKRAGHDSRFVELKQRFFRFLLTWTLGGMWVFITAAAGLAAITADTASDTSATDAATDPLFYIGLAIWVLGFGLEVIADRQKTVFRRDPANAGKFISTGLWAKSRHPNYLGEMILWIGVALIALPELAGWQFVTLFSPLFVILLLTRVSGINLLEAQAESRWSDDPEYQKYAAATPVLVPKLAQLFKSSK